MWRFCTLNINSFTNWDKCLAVKEIYECDLVCFQETRLVGARAADAEDTAQRRGWRACCAAAVPSSVGGLATGGLLTMVPEEHGLGAVRGGRDPVLRAGRVQVLHHSGAVRGGVVVANIYLESGVGMNVANREMLRDLACRVKEYSLPYVAMGDFNMTKDELEASEVLKWFDAECVAPSGPTCVQSGRTIDMFLVSRELIVNGIAEVEGSPVFPHKPVVLTIAAKAHRPWIRVYDLPKVFPTQRPLGCWAADHAARWARAKLDVQAQLDADAVGGRDALTRVWQLFLTQAESEWIDVYQVEDAATKHVGRGTLPVPRWVRRLPVRAARWPRVSAEATWLFRVANAVKEAGRPDRPVQRLRALRGLSRLLCHAPTLVEAACSVWLNGTAEADAKCSLDMMPARWLCTLRGLCLDKVVPEQLSIMAQLLHDMAVKLATRDMDARARRFKEWIGEQASGGAGGLHAVTKLPMGWHESPTVECEGVQAPADLGQEVAALEQEWKGWWRVACSQRPLTWPSDLGCRPARPSVDDVRRVLMTFKRGSGTSFCAIRPRQLNDLCDEGIEVLIDIIVAVEREACWPELVTKVGFLQKRLGGVRPIALIMVLARVQARLRRGIAKEWEDRNARPYWWASAGRSCERAVWH